jgi:hypothetical protein
MFVARTTAGFTSYRQAVAFFCALALLCCAATLQAQTTRPFKMATTAVQMLPLTHPPYRNSHPGFPFSEVAADTDMITLWPEYIGIPFDIFALGPTIDPNHAWAQAMTQMAADANAPGKELLLELGFVRTGVVSWASDVNGELIVQDGWAGVCYDFTTPQGQLVGDAFVNYAVWMAQTFQPAYLVNFIEANLYYHDCGGPSASWDALVSIQNRAYDAVKALYPDLPVFPSIKIESLYGQELDGFIEEEYQAVTALKRDLFGISIYPFGVPIPGEPRLANPYDLPLDYLVRVMLRHPEEKLAIAETGWNVSPISIGDTDFCIQNFPYSEESWVRDYMGFVFASAHFGQFEFVNWWSMRDSMSAAAQDTCYVRDSIPYLACEGDPWCTVMNFVKDYTFENGTPLFSELVQKAFGSFGLRTYSGAERPMLMPRWRQELALPLQPPAN